MTEGYRLPTDTSHTMVETRQYNLLGMDLGEGVPRSSLRVAAWLFGPWLLLMLAVGAPLITGAWPLVWVGPPLLATWLLVVKDDSGRVRLRSLHDAVMFHVLRRHRAPILNAGTTHPDTPRATVVGAQFVVVTVPADPEDSTR